jgi:two-component system, OmpR family, response regulator
VRVLYVEDEVALADTVRRGLTAQGFTVDLAHDGPEGLWAGTETAYDVIVLDLMLPGMDGYEVLQGLRRAGVWTPILMLTARDSDRDTADALDLGADDYLTKPFSFVVLVARLRALVRRGAPERPTVMRAGDLTLDPATREVARAGTPIALTAREYALLEFLMRRKGEVVTKTEILDNIWDANFEGPTNVVEVYIGYLRRKVDTAFGCNTILTVRGFGYRLDSGESALGSTMVTDAPPSSD